MSKKYIHDCEQCEYLGSDDKYDYYTCGSDELGYRTFIARYGDDGHEYESCPIDLCQGGYEEYPKDSPVAEAYRRFRGI